MWRSLLVSVEISRFSKTDHFQLTPPLHSPLTSDMITFLLYEAIHPTSMCWVMTLLGAHLLSSLTFAARFKTLVGFQALVHVLPSFYDCPDVYYLLFYLVFGNHVYPMQPEVPK